MTDSRAPRQKDVFLASEGDAWFVRNHEAVVRRRLPDDDAVLQEVVDFASSEPLRVLEIGCGEGGRLDWLKQHRQAECFGVEPSQQAVDAARMRGLDVRQGTADSIPFSDASVDVLIFGFCLYLCDREDLPTIIHEANRVLRQPGWLVIEDFFSVTPRERRYHHHAGVNTFKMDYRSLFDSPDYLCMTHKIRHHSGGGYTDDPEEWVAVSVLRRLRARM